MEVDRDLFLYDMAIVAIMKNEAPYVKEWLDYHLAAGVDHFFIYDNESPDNFKEVLQPYIEDGIVTYIFYPGTSRQVEAYTEAFKTYRFFCRYIAFIDADEFIFPQNKKTIPEFVDNFTKNLTNFGGLGISWMMYGSNNLEKADYSKGVLERFTRRAEKTRASIKTIANPRRINYMITPHYMYYFTPYDTIYEQDASKKPRILINHYKLKSLEEYQTKINQGSKDATYGRIYYEVKNFSHEEDNEVFDDSILKYRATISKRSRYKTRRVDYEKSVKALMKVFTPMLKEDLPSNFFEGKMETFLTCRALASYLKETMLDNNQGELLENLTLNAICSTLHTNLQNADIQLFLSELPHLLPLNYPIIDNIRALSLKIVEQVKLAIKSQIDEPSKFNMYKEWNEFNELSIILKGFENYTLK